ncbi:MAG: TolC family protein [Thermoanaerobaculia bacterium]
MAEDVPAGGLTLLEALRLTLERDPNVAIEATRVDAARGALQLATGRFDPVVGSGVTQTQADVPLSPTDSRETRTLRSTVGYTRELRSGLSLEPELALLRSEDVTAGSGSVNEGTLTFRLRQPLLRGRGSAVVRAEELSAERELAASGLDLRQTVSFRVLTVASQYWRVQAAARNLEVLRASEASAREMLATTRRLIEADQVPAAEQVQLEANLAAKESSSIGGERLLFGERQGLGREIGLDPAEIRGLPLPSDPFPAVAPGEVPPDSRAGDFISVALRRRTDLEAARQRQTGVDVQRRAFQNALQPQLDLIFAPAYSGLVAGSDPGSFFSPLYRNVPGAGATVSFNLSWPTRNQRARGSLIQYESLQRRSALAVDLLTKEIGADVPAALDAVARNAFQLAKARQAVSLFERAVVNEEKKLRAGSSTLLDLINQRDRLTAARQTEVSAELALALSLLDLRFVTGTLLAEGGEAGALEPTRLTTLPSPGEEAR